MASPTKAPLTSSLTLSREVIEEIRAQSFAGLKALQRRGLEIGGLLTASPDSDRDNFADTFRHVPCEYRYGPSYALSPSDLVQLAEQVDEAGASGERVLAFFRSCTRASMAMTPEDLDVIRSVLPKVRMVLMAKPDRYGEVAFGLFVRHEDLWLGPEDLERPRDSSLPIDHAARPAVPHVGHPPVPRALTHTDAPAASPRVPSEIVPGDALPAPRTKSRAVTRSEPPVMPPAAYQALTHEEVGSPAEPAKAPSVIRSGAVLAFVFLLLAGAFVWNRFYKAPGKNENNLGLSVHAEGSGLRVTWDRNIMAARNATGANLSISDGGAERRFSLDRNQLTTGSIFYTPKSGDVVIQFQTLNGANPGQSEMIRVLSGDRPSNSPLADSGSAPPVQTIEIPNLRKAEPARQAPDATLAEETETASEPKTFDAPKYDVAAPSTRTYLTPRQIAEPEVPPPAGSVQSLSTPNIPNPLRDAATAVSSAGAHSATMHRAAFVPPNPIKKIIPDKKGLSWNLNFPMEINVQVTVDKEGRVVEARDLAGSTPRFAVLVTECLRAARQWRFQPGTLDGTPVQSEYTIVFLFKP